MATVDEAQYDNRVLPQNAAPESAPARSPFTPIANYGFLSNCHTGALVGAGRDRGLAVRPALRLTERVRGAARPWRRRLPVRAVRDQRPERQGL